MTVEADPVGRRVALHAALADRHRLQILDDLVLSDRTPSELSDGLQIRSNLLAHHLQILEGAGLIERVPSAGDGRRRYVRLSPDGAAWASPPSVQLEAGHVLFVCTANAARSQLAAAAWNSMHPVPASSAGTRPAARVSLGAVSAAARAGLDISDARPRPVSDVPGRPDLVITVCDRAHEEMPGFDDIQSWHWSVPDPVPIGTGAAFDATVASIGTRARRVAPIVHPLTRRRSKRR